MNLKAVPSIKTTKRRLLSCLASYTLGESNFRLQLKVKWSRYRPGVGQRVGSGIALLFHDRGTRMGWVVSSTPWPHFTLGKDLVPIWQEAGWAPGPVWTGGNLVPTGIRSPTVQPVVSRNTDWATRPTIAVNRLQINNNPRCIESEYECTADVS